MQVRYDAAADRLLWQMRTCSGELFAVWLTRRMLRELWPPMHHLVTQGGIAQLAPNATVLPEARAMMAQAANARVLPGADFNTPFDQSPATRPLGPEPLLPVQIDMGPQADGQGLSMAVREAGQRQLKLQLSSDMAHALRRLVAQALRDADWGLVQAAGPGEAASAASQPPTTPPWLN